MRVIEILDKIEGKILTAKNKDAYFEGVYAGDLTFSAKTITGISNKHATAIVLRLDIIVKNKLFSFAWAITWLNKSPA